MDTATKPCSHLSPEDFKLHRVWEFVNDAEGELDDETYVRPVVRLPAESLANRLVSTAVTLANGQTVLCLLGNVDLTNAASTDQFLTVTVFRSSGGSFDLARYHDADYESRGPAALADFLGLPIDAVFPMRYDISDVAVGHVDCLRGNVSAIPAIQLTKSELIAMALH